MNPQRQFRMDVSEDSRLVTVETAKVALGVDLASIDAMIDEGALWAFNVSPKSVSRLREIRIWLRSLPGGLQRTEERIDAVISDIVGPTQELRCGEVQARLCVDDNTVHRLFQNGLLAGEHRRNTKTRTLWIFAPSLTRFLRTRVLGAV